MMLGDAATLQNGMIVLAAVLALTFFSLSLTRRAQRRAAASRPDSRAQFDSLREQSQLRSSMDDLLLQLEDVSRRINAQIDTKFVKLEMVVRDADDRIARLEKLLSREAQTGSLPGAPAVSSAPPARPSPNKSADPSPTETQRDSAPRATPNAPTARIHELADDGMSPLQIAETLGLPVGEVELVLNLRSFK